MTTQTFTVIGITTLNGNTKVRFANDIVRRIKLFAKSGCSRLDLIELPNAMTKIEALRYMLLRPEFKSPEDQATINDCLEDKINDARKHAGTSTQQTKTVPNLADIAARPRKSVTVDDILNVINS